MTPKPAQGAAKPAKAKPSQKTKPPKFRQKKNAEPVQNPTTGLVLRRRRYFRRPGRVRMHNMSASLNPHAHVLSHRDYLEKEQQFQIHQELIRSLLRIEQHREQPIDHFVKICCIYRHKLPFDREEVTLMTEPKAYLNKLSLLQLQQMVKPVRNQFKSESKAGSEFQAYWRSLLELIDYKIRKKTATQILAPELKHRLKETIKKYSAKLDELELSIEAALSNPIFAADKQFWNRIREKIRGKKIQAEFRDFYKRFIETYKEENEEQLVQPVSDDEDSTSPFLLPSSAKSQRLNPAPISQEEEEVERKELGEKIFREEHEKGKERLDSTLSVPKGLSVPTTGELAPAQSAETYDFISREIIQFEKYKRLQHDEQWFDDWVPCETEGRFRDRKPQYLNRVRVTCEWNKYNQTHYDQANPPPKTVQGYKFNIFYPDLFDKQKTPQYYLQTTESPDYCIIKFKAGPPYKDIAFKILRKQWDLSQKSGFQAVFMRGILHLHFNFKRPRYRI